MYLQRVLKRFTPQRTGRSVSKALAITLTTILCFFCTLTAYADDPTVTVATTYIDVHTGPGKGYPIFHIIEKDEAIKLEKRRTDWIKITTRRGKTGWIHIDNLANTQDSTGQAPDIRAPSREDYGDRRWELGFAGGDFDGADALGLNLGFRFTEHLTADLRLSQNTGQFSDSRIASVGLMHQPFPDWWVSPYFRLGTGQIRIQPSATLVEAEDREDNLFQTSLGAYVYLTRRFFLRLEMTQHQILTSRDTNEEVNEWQLGFNVYF
ncbi:SH3 domain-containing protein [Marinimicrobium sp. C6131]|uniref:SH3 domain-containing protein n=1 Tax=Marinimicrobium sp. C6131 TaxID=3022676 RepID=UPI00223E3DF3|nr:outer membrane beta-barrel protein [Marinimicrobium sp. C6131]UZJ43482.1 SH3 domain-containing protein [Marinimicrobium sp. C6131]